MNRMDEISEMDRRARAILGANDRGGYTVPTDGLYPYQWNWDSAFAAWGFGRFDPARAWAELETLFSGQWENGMVPHILFHKADPGYFPGPEVWGCKGPLPSSGISQPPVAASFARRIHEADPALGREAMARLWPRFMAWHRWFMTWRTDEAGAVCITHPWESGRDNAPDWDGAMARIDPAGVGEYQRRDTAHVDPHMRPTKYDYDRYIWLVQLGRRLGWDEAAMARENPFRVADPTMTFTLLRACRDMAALGGELGRDTGEIEEWITRLEAGAASLWNEALGSYDSRDVHAGTWSGTVSNASFLCWYAGLENARMLERYDRIAAAVKYAVPSTDPEHPLFDRKRYWRGPVWAIMNALIGIGLHDMGHRRRAEALRRQTGELIATRGFAEYFDTLDGSPAGGGAFTWTAAVWLAWASDSAEQY